MLLLFSILAILSAFLNLTSSNASPVDLVREGAELESLPADEILEDISTPTSSLGDEPVQVSKRYADDGQQHIGHQLGQMSYQSPSSRYHMLVPIKANDEQSSLRPWNFNNNAKPSYTSDVGTAQIIVHHDNMDQMPARTLTSPAIQAPPVQHQTQMPARSLTLPAIQAPPVQHQTQRQAIPSVSPITTIEKPGVVYDRSPLLLEAPLADAVMRRIPMNDIHLPYVISETTESQPQAIQRQQYIETSATEEIRLPSVVEMPAPVPTESANTQMFNEASYEKCEFNDGDQAPIFTDGTNRATYLTCASYGVPIRLPCPPSTFFDAELKTCVPEGFIDSSCGRRCMNGECIFNADEQMHECQCNVGYAGVNCTDKIDYCRDFAGNCGSGKCINQVGTYVCDCGYGMIGQSCDQSRPVPCSRMFMLEGGRLDKRVYHPFGTDKSSYITCFSEDSFVVRRCKQGQFWDQSLLSCISNKPRETRGECENYPCLSGGQCVNDETAESGYKCQCQPGYYGRHCEFMVNHCDPNPCNGHVCVNVQNPPGYFCECPNRIFDDCCCNDIVNKCPVRKDGGYYAEKEGMFVHCTPDGRAFVKNCPSGYFFDEHKMTCVKAYKINGATGGARQSRMAKDNNTFVLDQLAGGPADSELVERSNMTIEPVNVDPAVE